MALFFVAAVCWPVICSSSMVSSCRVPPDIQSWCIPLAVITPPATLFVIPGFRNEDRPTSFALSYLDSIKFLQQRSQSDLPKVRVCWYCNNCCSVKSHWRRNDSFIRSDGSVVIWDGSSKALQSKLGACDESVHDYVNPHHLPLIGSDFFW